MQSEEEEDDDEMAVKINKTRQSEVVLKVSSKFNNIPIVNKKPKVGPKSVQEKWNYIGE